MIRGKKINNENVQDANISLNVSIHNRFDFEVIDAKTGKVKQKAYAENVICDRYWRELFNLGYVNFSAIASGDGTGVPSTTDVKLFSNVYNSTCSRSSLVVDREKSIAYKKFSGTIPTTGAVGKNITEVGLASNYNNGFTYGEIISHAMLKDMNGNQISIEKTDTDVINIYATVYCHYKSKGIYAEDKSIYLSMKSDNMFSQVSEIIKSLFGENHGNNAVRVGFSQAPGYVSGFEKDRIIYFGNYETSRTMYLSLKKMVYKMSRLEPSKGNFVGGITNAVISNYSSSSSASYYSKMLFLDVGGSWFSHSTITQEIIGTGDGVTKDFSLKFQYARNVRVYINGEEIQNFTCDYFPNFKTSNGGMFTPLAFFKYIGDGTLQDEEDIEYGSLFNLSLNANTSSYYGVGFEATFYNTAYMVGLKHINFVDGTALYLSNDLKNWHEVYDKSDVKTSSGISGSTELEEEYQHFKYVRIKLVTAKCVKNIANIFINSTDLLTFESAFVTSKEENFYYDKSVFNVLHLENAPEQDAIITASYDCDCIAKDDTKVLDFSFEITFNEKVDV